MPAIPLEVMDQANRYAKKAYRWYSRELERFWRREYGGGSLDNIIASHDIDYGDAHCFAGWAGNEVFRRAGLSSIEQHADIGYDPEDGMIIEPWRNSP